jgi:hypothetical protein
MEVQEPKPQDFNPLQFIQESRGRPLPLFRIRISKVYEVGIMGKNVHSGNTG